MRLRSSLPALVSAALVLVPVSALAAPPVTATVQSAARPTLHPGDTGPAVQELQRRLHVVVDGEFGPTTLRALLRFKAKHKLPATEVVDTATWRVLIRVTTASAASRSSARSSLSGFACPVGPTHDITDSYGDPRGDHRHQGDDIMAPYGSSEYAVEDGVVQKAYYKSTPGWAIILRGASGSSYYYAHQSKNLVHTGERVSRGDVIGLVGNSGDAAGASAHLHFEYWKNGSDPVDPYGFVTAACS